MKIRHAALLGLAFAASPALAQPSAYAQQWSVQAETPGAYAITLTPEIYQQIQRDDLGDMAAFNRDGEELAFGPLAPLLSAAEPQWRDAHWFILPAASTDHGGSPMLQVNRAADGAISLRAEVAEPGTAAATGDLLIDTGIRPQDNTRLHAIAFEFAANAADFSVELSIDASDDLENWRIGVARASLLRVRQGEQTLQRRQIEWSGARARYLRLYRKNGSAADLPLSGIQVSTLPRNASDPRPSQTLTVESSGRDGDAYVYRLPARIPVERINLHLPQDNAVAEAHIASREDGRQAWRWRGNLVAFRLRADGVALDNEPLSLIGPRDREWRVTTDAHLLAPPVLEFAYRPERWLLLTQGPAPYVIGAGSSTARREPQPLAALLAPVRAKYGQDWQPTPAALGAPVTAAGDAALRPSTRERWSNLALWTVLIAAAMGIGAMVLHLLREARKT